MIPYYICNLQINSIFLQDWIFDICIWWLSQMILHRYLDLRSWWKLFLVNCLNVSLSFIYKTFAIKQNPSFPLSECLKTYLLVAQNCKFSSEMEFWNQFYGQMNILVLHLKSYRKYSAAFTPLINKKYNKYFNEHNYNLI